MANEQNLLKGEDKHKFTLEEASRGGIASAKARKARKNFKEAIKLLLETEIKSTDENGNEIIKSIQEIGLDSLANKYMLGDLNTFLAFRDTIGEKPIEKQEITEVPKIVDDV